MITGTRFGMGLVRASSTRDRAESLAIRRRQALAIRGLVRTAS